MIKQISKKAIEIIKKMQQSELTESVIYAKIARFAKGEELDLNDATKIVGFTQSTFFPLTSQDGKNKKKYTYVVTALDRLHNESKPQKTKIKL